ncbi:MAG: hypothetical protein NT029_18490 [Armatimonadetes bacterium]|nr:hypothetical protein [Armatimonadota bacterium]
MTASSAAPQDRTHEQVWLQLRLAADRLAARASVQSIPDGIDAVYNVADAIAAWVRRCASHLPAEDQMRVARHTYYSRVRRTLAALARSPLAQMRLELRDEMPAEERTQGLTAGDLLRALDAVGMPTHRAYAAGLRLTYDTDWDDVAEAMHRRFGLTATAAVLRSNYCRDIRRYGHAAARELGLIADDEAPEAGSRRAPPIRPSAAAVAG